MKRIKKIKHRVAALIMSLSMALGLSAPAFNIEVKAEAATILNATTTIADIIVTYCTSVGAGITNTTVLGNLYDTVGSSFGTIADFVDDGLLVVDQFGNYIDNGLGNAINSVDWSQVGLNVGNMFSATSEQVAAGSAVATTAGANLASCAGSLAGGGLIGTVAAAGGAVVAGIALGLLIDKIRTEIAKQISIGSEIDVSELILNNSYAGGRNYYYDYDGRYTRTIMVQPNYACCLVKSGKQVNIYICGQPYGEYKTTTTQTGKLYTSTLTSSNNTQIGSTSQTNFVSDIPVGNPNSIGSAIVNGSYMFPEVYSPDVIGPNGNQTASYNNGVYETPDLLPQINPGTQGMKPIPQQQWLDFANSANQNTNTSATPQADNAELFDNLIGDYINTYTPIEPEPEPEPEPDPNPNPDPETVPSPDLNPYPDNYPVAVPEDVPADKPQPDYTEKQTENETDIIEGDPYTTPNLLNKFPFCIPRDILLIFQKLNSGSREAPHIVWHFNPNNMIDYTFDIDFSIFNNVAALLRLLELLAFIVALGIATRNLILS